MGRCIISLFISSMFLLLSTLVWAESTQEKPKPRSKAVTKRGQNSQPVFVSKTGFVYVSKNRKNHKDTQLYFKDLATGKEKQITHQVGQLSGVFYLKSLGQILYSSTTDEEKEAPYILKEYLNRFPASVKNDSFFQLDFSPQEIYQSKLDGSSIERLTESSGYDGFPVYLPEKDRLYFSRWHDNQMHLYAKSLKKKLAPWKVMKTQGHDLGLQISNQKDKFTWFRFSPDFKSSQVLVSDLEFNNPTFVTLDSGVNWSPTWHPNGKSIIYSAKYSGDRNFNLYEVSQGGECKRQITSDAGDQFFPTLSPNGKVLLYTSTQSGQEQIYRMRYPGPLHCP